MTVIDLFDYLNRLGLADQIHLRNNEQMVYYHWNKAKSDLIPSVLLKEGRIENLYYPRSNMPKVYALANQYFDNNITEEHRFVKDKRDRKQTESIID